MVYAKYIKRNGKKYGPYYYKSVRTVNGKVKTIYVKEKPSTSKVIFKRTGLISMVFMLLLLSALFTQGEMIGAFIQNVSNSTQEIINTTASVIQIITES